MQITRSSIDTAKGPADWFTGDVYIDAVAAAPAPSQVTANLVHRPRPRHAALQAVAAVVLVIAVPACGGVTQPPSVTPSSEQHHTTTQTAPATSEGTAAMTIRLTIDGHQIEATLTDSAAARDLATLLPLNLDTEDFHRTERVAYPPRELDTSGAPDAVTPEAGDLAYYAPWGNLAFFYRDGPHSPGLVILGRLTHSADIERLNADRIAVEARS